LVYYYLPFGVNSCASSSVKPLFMYSAYFEKLKNLRAYTDPTGGSGKVASLHPAVGP
jgi:hypothetical protein